MISGIYYKPVTIVNNDSRVVNKLEASLTDDARVTCLQYKTQYTGLNKIFWQRNNEIFSTDRTEKPIM